MTWGKTRVLVNGGSLILFQEILVVEKQIRFDFPLAGDLLNGIPKTIFKFTLPKSIDSLVYVLDRIAALMNARENSYAMAC